MVSVHDGHIKPVFIPYPDGRRGSDGLPIIGMFSGRSGDPGFPADRSIPGFTTIPANRNAGIANAFSSPGPSVWMLGIGLKNRAAIRMRPVRMKPTQQANNHSFRPKRMQGHWLVVILERMGIFGIRVKGG